MIDLSQSLIFSDLDKANFFNSSFQTFFTKDNKKPFKLSSPHFLMQDFEISYDDILKACAKMKQKISRTPEGIPSLFIKKSINSFLFPLHVLFNLFLSSNFVPAQWKTALIVPIFKKGDRRKASNYRPISLTSSFSRLFESVILDKMIHFTTTHELISRFQFGFLPNRSSCSNLLSSLYHWIQSHHSSHCMKVLYTDIKKAFDSVNHRLIINVLSSLGINDHLVKWLKNFLSNRHQQVCINSSVSSPLQVYSGVPQGSVIAPFLFSLVFNGISELSYSSSVHLRLFADDKKLFSSDSADLQQAINRSEKWLTEHQLLLAPEKCAILKIKKSSMRDSSDFFISSYPVNEVQSFSDLGITVSSDLKWTSHIDKICCKASIVSYQLFKSIRSKNIWTWMKLYNTYVRPKVEYNTPVWSPSLTKDVTKLERFQRYFTKFAFQKCSIPFESYEDRLKKIGYISLEKRRIYFDLVLLFKIISNSSDLKFNDYFSFTQTSYSLRSHSLQIRPLLNLNSNHWQNSFFGRVSTSWNSLPANIVHQTKPEVFKTLLKIHLNSLT